MTKTVDQKVADFWNGWYGRKLLKEYQPTEFGTWHIVGEDPNADFGGSHHNPHIAYVTGYLQEVVTLAVQSPRFYSWGSGGNIERIEVLSVAEFMDTLKELEKINQLEQELKDLKAKRR